MDTTKSTQESSGYGTATTPRKSEDLSGSSAMNAPIERGEKIVKDVKETVTDAYDRTKGTVTEAYDRTKETVNDAYDRTARSLNEGYTRAVDYGRANPGKVSLIIFGAGLGVGLLLANTGGGRSRRGRIVAPVMNALTDVARELFR
jgi:ElaB/YqjD/DUF883 family membrane-anchored ribosome-binding protein